MFYGRESAAARLHRAGEIISRLRTTYPDAHCELNYRNPLELLVATILSAQCTDKMVNRVTPQLFAACPEASAYTSMLLDDLAKVIHSLGFFRNKAKNIQACCRLLVEQHGGVVPREMAALIQLPGVGRKTANVVLGNAFGIQEGIVVDTHVSRLSQRLGLSKQTDPEKIEQDLMPLVPRSEWTLLSHLLIWHGRRRCYARNPDCSRCEVFNLCPTGRKFVNAT